MEYAKSISLIIEKVQEKYGKNRFNEEIVLDKRGKFSFCCFLLL
jgi:hypothetical protein